MLSKRPGVCSPNQGLSDLGFVGLKYGMPSKELPKKLFTLLDLCVSSLRRGHANLLCIVPILSYETVFTPLEHSRLHTGPLARALRPCGSMDRAPDF